jgi:L-cysteine---[L-cysteinyl-carrier protein] ligase PchF
MSDLSAAKQELVRRLLRGRIGADSSARLADLGFARSTPKLQHDPAGRFDKFPLTEMQQAYWVGRQRSLELGNVAIHSYLEIHMDALDVDRLERAWNAVIRRHDVLRAIIHSDGYQQTLRDVGEYRIHTEACATRGECDARRAQLRDRMSHEVFDTERWPLFALAVTQGPDSGVVLHVSVDGVLIDAWSLGIVIRECLELYESPDLQLPELAITFRDYVMARRLLRDRPSYQESLSWWRRRLETMPGPPDLPLLRQPRMLRNPKFVRRSGELDAAKWRRLRQKAGAEGITPPCLMLTLYAEVLSRWASNRKFTLNVPRFDRPAAHPQIDDLVGEFASFTLLICDLSRPATLLERCRHLQQQMWEALEHGDVDGLTVIRELIRMRGRGGASFPVVLTANPSLGSHRPRAATTALPWRVVHAITQTPQIWLDFQVGERDECLSFNWDAVDELFPPGLLDEANEAFRGLVEALAEDESRFNHPVASGC